MGLEENSWLPSSGHYRDRAHHPASPLMWEVEEENNLVASLSVLASGEGAFPVVL